MNDFGIVSNCWQSQLTAGTSLDALIAEAEARGYRSIELRQGCLGAFESAADGGPRPDAAALRAMPARFPDLTFNLAMALPYLGETPTPETPLFQEGLRAALALGGAHRAHLRLVDPVTPTIAWEQVDALASRLTSLASACAARGAILSVENSRQPWAVLRQIIDRVREQLGVDANALLLCYDPCNLLNAADRPDPEATTAQLRAEEIALFHVKQATADGPSPEAGPGAIDWPRQWAALRQIGYTGPILFEIPPGPDIWERLERSRRYVDGL